MIINPFKVSKSTKNIYYAVEITESIQSPLHRCEYPASITINGVSVKNDCHGFIPAGSSTDNFDMHDWADTELVQGIKPVLSNGASTPTFTDAPTNASTWVTGNEYFTIFPFWWLSITKNNDVVRIVFSNANNRPDSTFQCFAHAKACDSYSNSQIENAMSSVSRDAIMNSNNNSYFANAFLIGCFEGNISSNNLYSRCNNPSSTGSTNLTLMGFFKSANARGNEYDCMSFQQLIYLQALFILLYKSTNSQAAHSQGLAKVGSESLSAITTNAPLATDLHGMAGQVNVAERMAFFWIHDIWGNMLQHIGGAWFPTGSTEMYYWLPRTSNSRAFSIDWTTIGTPATQRENNSTNRTALGTSTNLSVSGSVFIKSVCGDNKSGFLFSSTTSGASTAWWCDYSYISNPSSSTGAYFFRIGGYAGSSSGQAGIFYNISNTTTDIASQGSTVFRLVYRGGAIN